MKKLVIATGLFCTILGITFFSCKEKKISVEKSIELNLLDQIDRFQSDCKLFLQTAEEGHANEKRLQQLFLQTRLSYKKFEWAAEYFVPVVSRKVNGPPLQELEGSGEIIEPEGLQVIEGFLFPVYDISHKKDFIEQLKLLQVKCLKYQSYFKNTEIFSWQVFDAVKLEIFRIMTLGITGFDNPLTRKSMEESAASLESLQHVLYHYDDHKIEDPLNEHFGVAIKYLTENSDFNSFNRMEFLVNYCNPATRSLTELRDTLQIHGFKFNRLLNQAAKTLFDTNTFNVNAFAPDFSANISKEKIALGEALFSDPILSGNGKRSCRSCHQPERAFADGLIKNTQLDKSDLLERNTPTLINAALQPALFYDLRVASLEDQSHTVMQNKSEMHGSIMQSGKKLWSNKKYREGFLKAFPSEDQKGIDTFEIMNVLGSYIRSLTLLNSRFDEYMRGNKISMSQEEINGFNLFMGKAKCATCHYMPIFNGTFPPKYRSIESEVIGVPASLEGKTLDPDLGRYNIIPIESFKHAFKIPTVRNAARTAPYMHNGVFTDLDQVMDFYNKGGGAGLGFLLENQTLPKEKLDLTKKERDEIIAFIKSLDSRY